MDNVRRPMPVSVPHMISLSNSEVDRIVMQRLREIAYGILVEYPNGVMNISYCPYGIIHTQEEVLKLKEIRDRPRLHEMYVSYLAHELEWALRLGPLKTPDKP